MSSGKLILISNAEPYAHEDNQGEIVQEKQPGGLTTGLDPLMQEEKGLWVAWGRGEADFEMVDEDNTVQVPDEDGYTLKRLNLSQQEVQGFYYGFSNSTLWPISHNFVTRASFSPDSWEKYRRVNRKYARAALEDACEKDWIWVQDYQLCLVPGLIREKMPSAKIAHFWHIPWPAAEIFSAIPWRQELLEGLLGSDLLGFHNTTYLHNFLQTALRSGAEVDWEQNLVHYQGRTTRLTAIPLGIDYDYFSSMAKKDEIGEEAERIREYYDVEHLLIGIDRLDYTKGIVPRLKAIEKLLDLYPEYREEIVLIQRVAPSRTDIPEYQKMREKIDRTVGEINGRFQTVPWEPICYFWDSLPQEELIPYYLAADAAFITPLIDGLNLVSKEYLASREDGQLILSEFAGVSEQLEEAFHVNPYHIEEVAETIHEALQEDSKSKHRRCKKLRQRISGQDIGWWREKFLEEWENCYE